MNVRHKFLVQEQGLLLLPCVTSNVWDFYVSPTLIPLRAAFHSLDLV